MRWVAKRVLFVLHQGRPVYSSGQTTGTPQRIGRRAALGLLAGVVGARYDLDTGTVEFL
jgi:hypothetical protein